MRVRDDEKRCCLSLFVVRALLIVPKLPGHAGDPPDVAPKLSPTTVLFTVTISAFFVSVPNRSPGKVA